MTGRVFWKGKVMAAADAAVPVHTAALQLGVMPYETLRIHRGVPIHVQVHLDRFERSCQTLGVPMPPRGDIEEAFAQVTGEDGPQEALLRVAAVPSEPNTGLDLDPELPEMLVTTRPLPVMPEQGIAVVTAPYEAIPPRAWVHQAKVTGRTTYILSRAHARANGAAEALFQSREAGYTEGTVSNLFVVHGEHILTPPSDYGILAGITREWALAEVQKKGHITHQITVTHRDLVTADEVFLTGTGFGIAPVIDLDGRQVGGGKPGPVVEMLRTAYNKHLDDAAGPIAQTTR